MDTRRLISLGALIAANLVPLGGCFYWEWDAGLVVLFFWIENLIIGGFNILKMAALPCPDLKHHLGKLFMVPFFLVHYGGFCAGHGLFLLVFINGDTSAMSGDAMSSAFAWGPFVFVALLIAVVKEAYAVLPGPALWGVLSLVFSHGVSFVLNFWKAGEFRELNLQKLMSQPYKRIVLLHVVIIAGGAPVMMMGSPLPLLVLLVVGKIVLDAVMHLKERQGVEGVDEVNNKLT